MNYQRLMSTPIFKGFRGILGIILHGFEVSTNVSYILHERMVRQQF